ncbi:hypothetical protein TSAR_011450 [Trichomalopsis sarcophagae]|uniref:Uncharacterized protein n=1 Tax=Trichomalopsis sarcophagae TaxID=543379 RepID=A0A232EZW4_9HYME|nr:hypothetical protein TSAR_011450 [Trichomalopsis sarcophagae]
MHGCIGISVRVYSWLEEATVRVIVQLTVASKSQSSSHVNHARRAMSSSGFSSSSLRGHMSGSFFDYHLAKRRVTSRRDLLFFCSPNRQHGAFLAARESESVENFGEVCPGLLYAELMILEWIGFSFSDLVTHTYWKNINLGHNTLLLGSFHHEFWFQISI